VLFDQRRILVHEYDLLQILLPVHLAAVFELAELAGLLTVSASLNFTVRIGHGMLLSHRFDKADLSKRFGVWR
jgi:hypothetical protein